MQNFSCMYDSLYPFWDFPGKVKSAEKRVKFSEGGMVLPYYM